jgi:sulfur transfer complex TusBCD TusB component (DsrH family)
MDERAMKLTELPQITTNNITEADLIYLVQNGVSYAVNVAALAEYVLSLEGNN